MWYGGTAGWTIPKPHGELFSDAEVTGGTHLERYSRTFNAVEINSCFYRSHKPKTYARWASSVPEGFRFSVKLPKEMTHVCRLADTDGAIREFAGGIAELREKLGVVLIQLPRSLHFDPTIAQPVFRRVRELCSAKLALEARHASWFTEAASDMLRTCGVSRVLADPEAHPAREADFGAGSFVYARLHGSPRMYYSAYDDGVLANFKRPLGEALRTNRDVWCVFDNTAEGHATQDAYRMQKLTRGINLS